MEAPPVADAAAARARRRKSVPREKREASAPSTLCVAGDADELDEKLVSVGLEH